MFDVLNVQSTLKTCMEVCYNEANQKIWNNQISENTVIHKGSVSSPFFC